MINHLTSLRLAMFLPIQRPFAERSHYSVGYLLATDHVLRYHLATDSWKASHPAIYPAKALSAIERSIPRFNTIL